MCGMCVCVCGVWCVRVCVCVCGVYGAYGVYVCTCIWCVYHVGHMDCQLKNWDQPNSLTHLELPYFHNTHSIIAV